MKSIFKIILSFLFCVTAIKSNSQDTYRYSVNLNSVDNDALNIELKTPAVKQATAIFSLP
jgi:hypothetical protein